VARLGRRPDGGPDTRETILVAARDLFAAQGFDKTTIRAIATRAAVDPALVHHYFGTKDRLLAASLELPVDPAAVLGDLAAHPDTAGEELVRRVLALWEGDPDVRRRLEALLRTGISHDHAAGMLRDLFGRTILVVLRSLVVDDRPELRASLAGTQVGGLILGRYLVGIPAMTEASVEELVAAIGPSVQRYLTGSLGA
jgi:AcrR family transcriptional regulator